jgi:NAD(P)-dependent dehydrogenase (short-subunit alcohol dehydrogenase family)
MNDLKLKDRCVVVIGGTSGIGHALALGLAEAGANVVSCSRSHDATTTTTAAIRDLGSKTIAHTVDVTSRESIRSLHEAVIAGVGEVDVLVNCAGITAKVPTLDCSEETWNRIFDINLLGTLRACQVFGKAMIERGKGRIINIASLSTFVAFHEVAAYGASKAAVGALTRSLAVEWAPYGVLVNAIAPGIIPTALNSAILDSPRGQELTLRTPMRRFGLAEELVSTACYLASDQTTFTTGQIITVDGGFLASGVNQ